MSRRPCSCSGPATGLRRRGDAVSCWAIAFGACLQPWRDRAKAALLNDLWALASARCRREAVWAVREQESLRRLDRHGIPLVAGYVAAALHSHRPASRWRERSPRAAKLGIGRPVGRLAGAVMTLALVTSASRSGCCYSVWCFAGVGASIARGRLTRRGWIFGVLAVMLLALFVAAYGDMTPLLWRLEETLLVGTGGRPEIWQETLHIIRDFWPAGTGLGTYQTAMTVYQQSDRSVFFNQAHNHTFHCSGGGSCWRSRLAIIMTSSIWSRRSAARDKSSRGLSGLGGYRRCVAVQVQVSGTQALRMPAREFSIAVCPPCRHRPLERPTTRRRRRRGPGRTAKRVLRHSGMQPKTLDPLRMPASGSGSVARAGA